MTRLNNTRGFTLVELLISMVILGVVLTGVVRMFSNTGRYHTTQEMLVGFSQDLRAVKQMIVQELREAGCDPLNTGTFGFKVDANDKYDTDDNSIHFTRDIDNGDKDGFLEPDGEVGTNEDISYYRTNDNCSGATGAILASSSSTPGCLRRDVGGGGQPVMANVTGFKLEYYDQDGNELTVGNLNTSGKLEQIDVVRVLVEAQVAYREKVIKHQLDFRVLIRNG